MTEEVVAGFAAEVDATPFAGEVGGTDTVDAVDAVDAVDRIKISAKNKIQKGFACLRH